MNQKRYGKVRSKIVEVHGSNFNFSHALNIPESLVSKVLHGHRELSEEGKKKWAKSLNCTVKELFG